MIQVIKVAKITNQYNQVPHLTENTTWESDKHTFKHQRRDQEGSLFPAGDHKAAMNRRESNVNNTNGPQNKSCSLCPCCLVFKNIYAKIIGRRLKSPLARKELNASIARASCWTRGLNFGLSLHLHPYYVYASSDVLASLLICTVSPEHSLLDSAISINNLMC